MIKSINSGIYKIENLKTNKVYIGQAGNLKKRYCDHISALRRNKHDNSYLQKAWNKYDESDFKFSILEECPKDLLAIKEQYWMDQTKCYIRQYGYNLNPSSTNNPMLGKKHTSEAIAKMRAAAQGRTMSQSNFEALMLANKNVAKPPKNLEKKLSRKVGSQQPRNLKYEYHIFKPCGEYIMLTNLTEYCDINRCSLTHLRNLIFKNKFYKGWQAFAMPVIRKPSNLLPKIKLLIFIKTNYKYELC